LRHAIENRNCEIDRFHDANMAITLSRADSETLVRRFDTELITVIRKSLIPVA